MEGEKVDLNDKHKDLFIPQWFDKINFEDMLDKKLTDEQFQKIKECLLGESGEYLADKISDEVRGELLYLKKDKPELFIK